jgi:hypothetical protein
MPLHIDRVQTEMDIVPSGRGTDGTAGGLASRGGAAADMELKERLRPLVLEILREELDKLRRQQGVG